MTDRDVDDLIADTEWLIERGQPEGFVWPEWYVIDSYQGRWTRSPIAAQRFASEADAAAFIRRSVLTARPVRHGFEASATQRSRDVDDLIAAAWKAAMLIEVADNRAMAADGPVSHVRLELDDQEWRDLYVAVDRIRSWVEARAAAVSDNTLTIGRPGGYVGWGGTAVPDGVSRLSVSRVDQATFAGDDRPIRNDGNYVASSTVRSEDGLDVERLAKALGVGDPEWRGYLVEAERVAAEYVRLAADREEGAT